MQAKKNWADMMSSIPAFPSMKLGTPGGLDSFATFAISPSHWHMAGVDATEP
jgi:hypothetical protein